jgi:hypothetical protein
MGIDQATWILTGTLSLAGRVVSWGGQMVNPLDANSSFMDWLFSIAVIAPITFVVARYLIQLAQGYKFRTIRMRRGK